MRFLKQFLTTFACLISFELRAEILQILHTNDLHGMIENSVTRPEIGGYPAIKAIFEKYKMLAAKKRMRTLIFDAGDFLEGSLYYQVGHGKASMQLMDEMGYNAVALGNHDWLMGTDGLEYLFQRSTPKTSILAANAWANSILFPDLAKRLKSYKVFHLGKEKLAIMGLTTDEAFYSWRFYNTSLKNPIKLGRKLSEEIKEEGIADHVIALTHIGFEKDKELAYKAPAVDLVIGGHSHDTLFKPVWMRNREHKQLTPVLQAGAFGHYVGRLLVDLVPGKRLKIVKYELIPVDNKRYKDSQMSQHVHHAREKLEAKYSKRWLKQVIGKSEIPLHNDEKTITPWTAFITDAIREARGAQVSFHAPAMAGVDLPAGPITNEMIFSSYPRFFDFKDKWGWRIYDVKIMGIFLGFLVRAALDGDYAVGMSGITFDIIPKDKTKQKKVGYNDLITNDLAKHSSGPLSRLGFKYKIKNIKVRGHKVRPFGFYRVALPEGFVRGGLGITWLIRAILRKIYRSPTTVIGAIQKKLYHEKVIRADYNIHRNKARGRQYTVVSNKNKKSKPLVIKAEIPKAK